MVAEHREMGGKEGDLVVRAFPASLAVYFPLTDAQCIAGSGGVPKGC